MMRERWSGCVAGQESQVVTHAVAQLRDTWPWSTTLIIAAADSHLDADRTSMTESVGVPCRAFGVGEYRRLRSSPAHSDNRLGNLFEVVDRIPHCLQAAGATDRIII